MLTVNATRATPEFTSSRTIKLGFVPSAVRSFQRQGSAIVANIQICPPSPQLETFDDYQFYKPRSKAVTAKTEIAWSDYSRMGTVAATIPLKYAGYIPPFA